MGLHVLKFGGSSVGDENTVFEENHLHKIAGLIQAERAAGHQVVVVISAMAGATRQLKHLFAQIPRTEASPEEDVVLSAGEQITAGLLAGLLNATEYGIPARSLLGWQIPIITNPQFGQAEIQHIETELLTQCISEGIVPVIAGFQGMTESRQITTLGFDGSDTTAVAIAGALNADICRFYKDVRGVYTANPRRVSLARKQDTVSARDMHVLASLGARILHPNAIQTAMDHNVTLHIMPYFTQAESGTYIRKTGTEDAIAGITYFQYPDQNISVSVVGRTVSAQHTDAIIRSLNEKKIYAEAVKTEFDDHSVTVNIGWMEQLDTALQTLHTHFGLDQSSPQSAAFLGNGKQVYRDPAIGGD